MLHSYKNYTWSWVQMSETRYQTTLDQLEPEQNGYVAVVQQFPARGDAWRVTILSVAGATRSTAWYTTAEAGRMFAEQKLNKIVSARPEVDESDPIPPTYDFDPYEVIAQAINLSRDQVKMYAYRMMSGNDVTASTFILKVAQALYDTKTPPERAEQRIEEEHVRVTRLWQLYENLDDRVHNATQDHRQELDELRAYVDKVAEGLAQLDSVLNSQSNRLLEQQQTIMEVLKKQVHDDHAIRNIVKAVGDSNDTSDKAVAELRNYVDDEIARVQGDVRDVESRLGHLEP